MLEDKLFTINLVQTLTGGHVFGPMATNRVNHKRKVAAFLTTLDNGGSLQFDGVGVHKSGAIVEIICESAKKRMPEQPKSIVAQQVMMIL